jgi:hypothetical protein
MKGKINLLELIPQKNCRWETGMDGNVCLVVPRLKNRILRSLAVKLGKSEYIKVHYDLVGSKTWHLIDGYRSVAEIGDQLEKELGDQVQPKYERLSEFIAVLFKNKFITFKNT